MEKKSWTDNLSTLPNQIEQCIVGELKAQDKNDECTDLKRKASSELHCDVSRPDAVLVGIGLFSPS